MAFDWTTVEGYREDMTPDEKLELLDNWTPAEHAAADVPANAPSTAPIGTAPASVDAGQTEPAPAAKSAATPQNPLMREVAWKRERDKLTAENGNLRKEMRKYMNEQQALEAERRAELEARNAELEALRRDKTLSDFRANFIGRGYDEATAQQAAEALADGDANALFDIMARQDIVREKAMRAKILAETPKPPASDPNSEEAKRQDQERLRGYFGLSGHKNNRVG